MDIQSGSSEPERCNILPVKINTINIMGDVIEKLGLQLSMSLEETKDENKLCNISNIHQRISKRIFNRYPHLCTMQYPHLGLCWAKIMKHDPHLNLSSTQLNTEVDEYRYILRKK